MNENEALNERLAEPPTMAYANVSVEAQNMPPQILSDRQRTDADFAQWQVGGNGRFRPGQRTVKQLKPGAFRVGVDEYGNLYFEQMRLLSDDVVQLPDTATSRVLESIRRFWGSREKYDGFGLIYKRGILLWGPPGSGKTVTVQMLTRELIDKHKGVVLMCDNPQVMVRALVSFRQIEPNRPIIVILEDIDEIIAHQGEHAVLAMLDGEHQTDNIVYLATTNYPERLGARIVNRPSRFDDRILVGMPSRAARQCYLERSIKEPEQLKQWVDDTDGMSIAHLRELVAAVFCLDQQYVDVIERLKHMMVEPKPLDGFRAKTGLGFGQSRRLGA